MKTVIFRLAVLALFVVPVVWSTGSAAHDARQAHHDLEPLQPIQAANALALSASDGMARAASVFRGPGGLTGVVLEEGADQPHKSIGWITPDGKVLIVNARLINAQGVDLTQEAMFDQGLQARPAAALEVAASPESKSIVVGRAGLPIVTVFFDPNCIYCHLLDQALAEAVDAAKIRIRYVIVGTLKESSIPRAASILAASDPAKAIAEDRARFDRQSEEGGYPVDPTVNADMERTVRANNMLFTKLGAQGTPAVLFCSKASHSVEFQQGVPADMPAFIADAATGPAAECGQ